MTPNFCLITYDSALEGAESTLLMASGMCASTALLLALVPAGGHLVTTTDCYRKTRIFIETILPKMGIKVIFSRPNKGTYTKFTYWIGVTGLDVVHCFKLALHIVLVNIYDQLSDPSSQFRGIIILTFILYLF